MDITDMLPGDKKTVECWMEKTLPRSKEPQEVYGLIWDFLDRGGKRFRPLMCLLACQAVGGDEAKAVPVAASIELFHNFTLIHDDIEDNSQMRRGKPCLHITYGLPLALNAGDGLFMAAWKAALDSDLPPEKTINVANMLYNAFSKVLEGQAIELKWHFGNVWGIGPQDYLRMVRGKTGALIGGACETGAFIGGASMQQCEALRVFGEEVGIAFQIQDDILNLIGDEKKYKKEIGGDIVEGKRTLMVLDTLSKCSGQEAIKMQKILDSKSTTPAEVRFAIKLLKKYGSIDFAAKYARDLIIQAKPRLSKLPANEATGRLRQMADYLINREV